jgi:hypothetical protein
VELRGFEPLTFCMPSTGIFEIVSEKASWAPSHRSLKFAKLRLGTLRLLHSVAAPAPTPAVSATVPLVWSASSRLAKCERGYSFSWSGAYPRRRYRDPGHNPRRMAVTVSGADRSLRYTEPRVLGNHTCGDPQSCHAQASCILCQH